MTSNLPHSLLHVYTNLSERGRFRKMGLCARNFSKTFLTFLSSGYMTGMVGRKLLTIFANICTSISPRLCEGVFYPRAIMFFISCKCAVLCRHRVWPHRVIHQYCLLAAAAGHTAGGSHRPFGPHSVVRMRPCSRSAEARRLPPTTDERSRAARRPRSSCCWFVYSTAFLFIVPKPPL